MKKLFILIVTCVVMFLSVGCVVKPVVTNVYNGQAFLDKKILRKSVLFIAKYISLSKLPRFF